MTDPARTTGDASATLPRRRLRIALTIDTEYPEYPAGQANTDRLLDALQRDGVSATFFVQGQWASAHPDLLRRVARDGHLIGNHSQWHAPATALRRDGLRDSVARAEAAILAACGVDPKPWFRGPYGKGMDERWVQKTLRSLGYAYAGWDVEAFDYRPGIRAEDAADNVVEGCLAHGDGARVLLHDWPNAALAALPLFVSRLRVSGAEFVRLDGLTPPDGLKG
jgi:peptidoglycan-N-acetylglucosamine deacetylase